jgi:hypothetical protein
MIKPEHIEEAAERWQDFQRVQCPEPQERLLAALRTMQAGIGLDHEAVGAFWLGMKERPIGPAVSLESVRADAELTGLIVGLTARQLADEEAEDEESQGLSG